MKNFVNNWNGYFIAKWENRPAKKGEWYWNHWWNTVVQANWNMPEKGSAPIYKKVDFFEYYFKKIFDLNRPK